MGGGAILACRCDWGRAHGFSGVKGEPLVPQVALASRKARRLSYEISRVPLIWPRCLRLTLLIAPRFSKAYNVGLESREKAHASLTRSHSRGRAFPPAMVVEAAVLGVESMIFIDRNNMHQVDGVRKLSFVRDGKSHGFCNGRTAQFLRIGKPISRRFHDPRF